jgi:hypothetical protein
MRTMILASTLGAVAILVTSDAASAASPCGPGKVFQCRQGGNKPGMPPACRCVPAEAGPGSYGHAEVKKKNVPTVQPNKRSGRYD